MNDLIDQSISVRLKIVTCLIVKPIGWFLLLLIKILQRNNQVQDVSEF